MGKTKENNEEQEKLTRQEENWTLMTSLGIPWSESNKIDDPDDIKFLLEKCKEVQQFQQQQREQAARQQLL